MDFVKILNHPERDRIISKLTSGESARDVAEWIKEKYPKDKSKHVSIGALNEFRKEHLNVHGAVMSDIKKTAIAAKSVEDNKQLAEVVKKNKTYNEKLNEVIDTQIDWRYKLIQLLNIVETRFGQLFDKTQEDPNYFKPDYVMVQWMGTILELVEKIRKIEGAPDQIIQHNVTIQTVEEQSALIQEALRQTFAEVDIETSLLLMDKFAANLEKIKVSKDESINDKMFSKVSSELNELHTKALPAMEVK